LRENKSKNKEKKNKNNEKKSKSKIDNGVDLGIVEVEDR
jgi:hypothetical protein